MDAFIRKGDAAGELLGITGLPTSRGNKNPLLPLSLGRHCGSVPTDVR